MNKKSKKTISKKAKKLLIKELEKRVAPSAGTGKKPAIPGPYCTGDSLRSCKEV